MYVNFVTCLLFPQSEYVTELKNLQWLAGMKSYIYWFGCYLVDIIYFLVNMFLIAITFIVVNAYQPSFFEKEAGKILIYSIVLANVIISKLFGFQYSYKIFIMTIFN